MPYKLVKEEEELLNIIKSLSSQEQKIFISQLKSLEQKEDLEATPSQEDFPEKAEFLKRLGGKTYTRKERTELMIETLVRVFRYRRELLTDSGTTSQIAEILGVTRQAPYERYKAGTLLAIYDNGEYRFPLWQFDPNGPNGVIDGLPKVLKALKMSDFAKLSWLSSPNPYFEGKTPIALLKQGDKQRVIDEAMGVGIAHYDTC